MSLWKIAWRSIQSRSIASILTCLSMALGITLVVSVLVINSVVSDTFNRNPGMGYDLVVGKLGSDYQLVLNTLFHVGKPPQNLPYSYYKEFVTPEGRFKKLVSRAIPVCMGDNYEGFRVVATIPAMFDPDFDLGGGRKYVFAQGKNFEHERFFDAVIGAEVARQTGLRVADEFAPTHGIDQQGADAHVHDAFTVVGILQPTGTPNDRALFINIEGFYLLEKHAKDPPADDHAGHDHAGHDHDHGKDAKKGESKGKAEPEKKAEEKKSGCDEEGEVDPPTVLAFQDGKSTKDAHKHDHDHAGHDHSHHGHDHARTPLPENQREVTAILVRGMPNNPLAGMQLATSINKGNEAQAASPVFVVTRLFSIFVDPLRQVLVGLAILVVAVAGIGVLVNIYNTMNERRREIAVMRALGARRTTVFQIILLESILLSLMGGLAGWFLGHALTWIVGKVWLVDTAGVTIGFWQLVNIQIGSGGAIPIPLELLLVGGLVLLASVVGYLPAMSAYKTDVSKCLADSP